VSINSMDVERAAIKVKGGLVAIADAINNHANAQREVGEAMKTSAQINADALREHGQRGAQ
jgi:hypothetical protein